VVELDAVPVGFVRRVQRQAQRRILLIAPVEKDIVVLGPPASNKGIPVLVQDVFGPRVTADGLDVLAEDRPRPECSADSARPVAARSIRSVLVLNRSLARIGSLITTALLRGKFTLITPPPYRRFKAANIAWFVTKNTTAWMGFGIRGPGGSRTGSVVAVAMLSTPSSGTAKVSVPNHSIGRQRVPRAVPPTTPTLPLAV
jgi:hypothetical protein